MPYTAPTLAQAATALASRLNDPANVRWVVPELYVYLREALRTWQAWTAHWRDTGSVTTVVDQAFYDLPTEIPALRGYTVTNWDLVTDMQYALLEPAAAGGTWTGTDQFTLDQLSTAIQRRRDQFLRETGAVLTRSVSASAVPPASGRFALDEAILQVRRAGWRRTATMWLIPLRRSDEWAGNYFRPTWPTSTLPPYAYSTSVTPPLELQLMPPDTLAGSLDLITVNKGATVNPLASAVLGIPDDWCWVVKFGALADLLQGDGLALDPARAQYCEQRWQQGLEMAKKAAVVLAAAVDGSPVPIGAIHDADSYSLTWQLVNGVPSRVLLMGQNLVASYPPPGAVGGPWTITLDVVRNAPVPSLAADVIEISADVYDSILDLSQHLALFKEGPGQLELATALLERAARAAGVDLGLQQAQQPSRAPLLTQTQQDEHAVARELPSVPIV